jgi:AbrB family looped-hinge helix DNA binding protein
MVDVKVSDGGRVVIPAEYRAKLGIGVGDVLYWREEGEQLVLSSRAAGIRRAQAIVAKYKRPGVDEVEAFLRDKREEAARE